MRVDPSISIPTSESPSEVWISWHKSLLKWFSLQEANSNWIRFWTQRAGVGTLADTHDLRSYMKSQDVELSTNWQGTITDGASSVADWFSGGFTMIRNIFLGAVILAMALIAFYIISNIRKGKSASQMAFDVRTLGATKKVRALKFQKLIT